MASAVVPNLWTRAVHPSRHVGNGRDAATQGATLLADYANMLAGRRRKVLVQHSVPLNDAAGAAPAIAQQCLFRTSPGVTKVRCTMVCGPADTTGTERPSITWTVGGVAQTTIYVNRKNSGTVIPDELFVVEQDWTLASDTQYAAYCTMADYARILSVCIWEPTSGTLTTVPSNLTSDNAIHPPAYAFGQPVTDVGIQDFQDRVNGLWRRQGSAMAAWNDSDGSGALATTSATLVNVFDNSFTAWDAAAPGLWTYPANCGSLESDNVPVTCWVYAGFLLGGSTGEVSFRVNGATLATISGISGDFITVATATGNLDAGEASQKVDVLYRRTSGAGSFFFLACGIYQHVT